MAAQPRSRVREQVMTGHGGAARVRAKQGGEDADQRGLARAVRPEQGDDLAGRDGKVDPVENRLGPEGLAYAHRFQRWHGFQCWRRVNCVRHT